MKTKLILSLAALIMVASSAMGQVIRDDWYNASFEKEGVYGAEVDRAYDFLGKKKAKYRPVVAIIGAGADIEHEALKKNLWTNKKEKADGIDNDGNGYVDDFHGWSFIGTKNGQTMENTGSEGDREWIRLKEKYGDIMYDGKQYFVYKHGERQYIDSPVDLLEYNYFKSLNNESELARSYASWVFSNYTKELAIQVYADMRAKYPGRRLTHEDMKNVYNIQEKAAVDSLFEIGITALYMNAGFLKKYAEADSTFDYMGYIEQSYTKGGAQKKAWDSYMEKYNKYPLGIREKEVGDDGVSMENRVYGNNTLLTANSAGGTMIATLIAGERGVEGRNNPICRNAEIMPLVIVNQAGDPYLKDVAVSIRYAVDNGADVICFTMPGDFYPTKQKSWVEEAIRYAEEKGVLLVVNTAELSLDIDRYAYYPNRFMKNGDGEFGNILVVSPSDKMGNPMLKSNFGAKGVDLYAPGMSIMSGYIGDSYKVGSGSILSLAVTAGVAALVKSYYPHLTGSQIRTILNESVTSRAGAEVEKMNSSNKGIVQDMYLFDDLCLSKGIINAYKAVQAADKIKQ